ncbi:MULTISPECIES: phage holin [unclassified Exiguobacterium]|uniref:phage holin n=1 Tax=unclassified Exiguobacterium TaxID=2644629 RepID=UPI001AEB195E|nr:MULTISPECIES: phage holin [unclassified Exiguobacterium]
MQEKTKALITLVILVLTMINQALQLAGYSTIPFAPEKVEQFLSMLATAVVSVYAWWKNQNVTPEAQKMQRSLDDKKTYNRLNDL